MKTRTDYRWWTLVAIKAPFNFSEMVNDLLKKKFNHKNLTRVFWVKYSPSVSSSPPPPLFPSFSSWSALGSRNLEELLNKRKKISYVRLISYVRVIKQLIKIYSYLVSLFHFFCNIFSYIFSWSAGHPISLSELKFAHFLVRAPSKCSSFIFCF